MTWGSRQCHCFLYGGLNSFAAWFYLLHHTYYQWGSWWVLWWPGVCTALTWNVRHFLTTLELWTEELCCWNRIIILISTYFVVCDHIWVKVKQSHNRPSVAQRVPGGLGSQISWHSAHESGEVRGDWCVRDAPVAFTPRKCSWYSFSLGAESIPGPWYGRKECVTEKSSDATGNRSQDRPTSSAAP